jgi:hypothetical protein
VKKPAKKTGKKPTKKTVKKAKTPEVQTFGVVELHAAKTFGFFYAQDGSHCTHPFDPTDAGVIWFPGIKYRVTIEAIGYERRAWAGGPTLEEARTRLNLAKTHWEKQRWETIVAELAEHDRLRKALMAHLRRLECMPRATVPRELAT